MPWARQALAPIVGAPDLVTCNTCHGARSPEASGWHMPAVAALPRPAVRAAGWENYGGTMDEQMRNAIYGYGAESDKASRAAYMREVVMPGMAQLLGRPGVRFHAAVRVQPIALHVRVLSLSSGVNRFKRFKVQGFKVRRSFDRRSAGVQACVTRLDVPDVHRGRSVSTVSAARLNGCVGERHRKILAGRPGPGEVGEVRGFRARRTGRGRCVQTERSQLDRSTISLNDAPPVTSPPGTWTARCRNSPPARTVRR